MHLFLHFPTFLHKTQILVVLTFPHQTVPIRSFRNTKMNHCNIFRTFRLFWTDKKIYFCPTGIMDQFLCPKMDLKSCLKRFQTILVWKMSMMLYNVRNFCQQMILIVYFKCQLCKLIFGSFIGYSCLNGIYCSLFYSV